MANSGHPKQCARIPEALGSVLREQLPQQCPHLGIEPHILGVFTWPAQRTSQTHLWWRKDETALAFDNAFLSRSHIRNDADHALCFVSVLSVLEQLQLA